METNTQMFSQCIRNCTLALSHGSDEAAAALTEYHFTPRCPLVNVFWKGFKGREIVRSVFADFWPSGPLVGELVEYMDGDFTGENEKELRDELRSRAIMLLENRVIASTDTLRVAHYVSLSLPDVDRQIKGILALHNRKLDGISVAVYPLIFLLNDCRNVDASDGFERMLSCQKWLNKVPYRQIVALGPMLRDNSYLRRGNADLNEDQAEENYRIAADVAFLASTAPNSYGTPTALSAWLGNCGATWKADGAEDGNNVITASYLLMQKPSRRIVAVTLDTLRAERGRLAAEKEKELISQHVHDNATQFLARLELNKGLSSLDAVFDASILPTLPNESSLEPIINWDRARRAGSFETANELTGGALQLFAQRYFTVDSLDEIPAEALADSISRELLAKTDYLFAANYFKTCAAFLADIRPQTSGGIYGSLVNRARSKFYELMSEKLKDALLRRAEEAQHFRVSLQELALMLRLPPALQEAGLEDVDSFYRNRATSLIDSDELIAALQPGSGDRETYAAFESAFLKLIKKDPSIYLASLDEEVRQRTLPNADGATPNVIANFFGTDLSSKQRLPVMTVDLQNTQGFYLIHANANIGSNPQEQLQTVRTAISDRAERIQLYYVDMNSLLEGRGAK